MSCTNTSPIKISIIKDKLNKSLYYEYMTGSNNKIISKTCENYKLPDIISILKTNSKVSSFVNSPPISKILDDSNILSFPYQNKKCYLLKICNKGTINIDYQCIEDEDDKIDKRDISKKTCGDNIRFTNKYKHKNFQNIHPTLNSKGKIRCKQGYVVHGYLEDNKIKATIPWSCDDEYVTWGDDTTNMKKGYTNKLNDTSCVKDKCPNITIHNSNREWDVIHGELGKNVKINCNDGYSFNHDLLHKSGKIECNYVPLNKNNTIYDKNKMDWFVKDDNLKRKCNKFKTEDSCEGKNGKPVPKYNPYIDLYGSKDAAISELEKKGFNVSNYKDVPIGCVWSPPIKDKGNIVKDGKCHFRKKVNIKNNSENICQPLNCPLKSIPNSNRDKNKGYNPLPGPLNSKNGGKCIQSDGTLYKNIKTANDCFCHRHRNCNTCTYDKNCKWCDPNNKKDKPGCYSIYSNNSACHNKSIRQSGHGTCRDSNGNIRGDWGSFPDKDKTIDNCEKDNECINNKSKILDLSADNKKKLINNYNNNPNTKIKRDDKSFTDKELCLSYNNKWDKNIPNYYNNSSYSCYINKNINLADIEEPFGFINDTLNNYQISVDPWYCSSEKDNNNDNDKCIGINERYKCSNENNCNVIENIFDDNIYRFSSKNIIDNTYYDTVYLGGSKCYLNNNNELSSSSKNAKPLNFDKKFIINEINKTKNGDKYMILSNNNNNIKIDKKNLPKCKMRYIKEKITDEDSGNNNNLHNINNDICKNIIVKNKDLLKCLNGHLYCKPEEKTNKCADGSIPKTEKTFVGKIKNHCPYTTCNINKPDLLMCKQRGEKEYNYKDIHANFSSNCHKYIEQSNKNDCNNTRYNVKNKNGKSYLNGKRFYSTCIGNNIDGSVCELLNKKINNKNTVHWGQLCNDPGKKGIPLKLLCEENGGDWKREKNKTDNIPLYGCYKNDKNITNDICNSKSNKQCIVDVLSENKNILSDICSKWKINDNIISNIEFKIHKNNKKLEFAIKNKGVCIPGRSKPLEKIKIEEKIDSKLACEEDNYKFKKKYSFDNSSFCGSKFGKNNEADIILNWTGGNIVSDSKNNWTTNCSSTLASSCQVNCDKEFSGGGNFICRYNNHNKETCDIINKQIKDYKGTNNKKLIDKKLIDKCNSKISCKYNTQKKICGYKKGEKDKINGYMEWKGQSCFMIDNRAFSHGIMNYPKLDEFFPPLIRLIVFFLIIIIFTFLIYKSGIFNKLSNLIIFIVYKLTVKLFYSIIDVGKKLIFGIIQLVKDSISFILSGKYLSAPATIFNKIITIGYLLLIILVITLIQYSTNKKGIIDTIKGNWSYITKGYDDIEAEYDVIDESVVQDVS